MLFVILFQLLCGSGQTSPKRCGVTKDYLGFTHTNRKQEKKTKYSSDPVSHVFHVLFHSPAFLQVSQSYFNYVFLLTLLFRFDLLDTLFPGKYYSIE